MKRIEWVDAPYECGVDQGVFYPSSGAGMPWDGLVDVAYSPDGGTLDSLYRDGQKFFVDEPMQENFKATIHAVTCPDIVFDAELTQTRKKIFGFSYRVGTENGHMVHLVYNAHIDPDSILYQPNTVAPISFGISAAPISVPNSRPSAHLVVDTGKASVEAISALEDILYGSGSSNARLPLPAEVITLFANNMAFKVVDNGDGTWTATSTNGSIVMLDATTFQITTDSAVWVDTNTYTLYSF